MPRNAGVQVVNDFTRGLVTEATGLNFPENACTETFDCIFTNFGKVYRRLGIDYEDSATLNSVTSSLTDKAISTFLWRTVSGNGNLSFEVIQLGGTLHFFEVSSTTALSANKKSFTYVLSQQSVAGAPSPETIECQFASGNGDMFVFHPYLEPFYIEYDEDSDDITATTITIQVRDFDGVEDGLTIEERPSALSTLHKYNLYNQGWYGIVRVKDSDAIGQNASPLDYWDNKRSDYPSNGDVWWYYKLADTTGSDAGMEEFSTDIVNTFALGNTPAPKGHYILDAFYEDRSEASGLPGLSVVTAGFHRPSCGAFVFSRVFYAGVSAHGFSSNIYFSPVIEKESQYGKCYQNADPTAEDFSDLLPSDGGVIVIPDMGTAIKMLPVGNILLVFASNGIWAISGSEGLAFAANDYVVRKLSSVPSLSAASFVDVDGLPVWWNSDGIQGLQADQTSGNLNVVSVSDQTIKTFYQAIPSANLRYAKGAYNPVDKRVQWVYRNASAANLSESYQYDRILNLNTQTGAFFPWIITQPSSGPRVSGIIVTEGFGSSRSTVNVIDGDGDTVIDGSSNNVVVQGVAQESLTGTFRYVTTVLSTTYRLTFSQENDGGYLDWATFDGGADFTSYFITGFKVHGEAQRFFQNNYVTTYSEFEAGSSCFIQGYWDYATSGDTGRWTTPQQVYPSLSNYGHQRTRRKIRGKGMALQLKYFSEEGNPFNIVGWSAFETGNAAP